MSRNPVGSFLMLLGAALTPAMFSGSRAKEGLHHSTRVRTYYIAADEISWDYAPSIQNDAMGRPFDESESKYINHTVTQLGRISKKAVYREYIDARFAKLKQRAAEEKYLGLLGPTLRGEVGDTIKVFFKNNASRPYSMHPHGLLYQKNSEGSAYNDGTSGDDKADDAVSPGVTQTYVWEIPERAGPGPNDPSSIIWLYHSHVNDMRDVASGLFGPIIVTAKNKARSDGRPVDVDREFITMLITLDENDSWYVDSAKNASVPNHDAMNGQAISNPSTSVPSTMEGANLRNTINGLMFGNMPLMTMKKGELVRWYLATLGDARNLHTAHWHGNIVTQNGHHTDVVALLPAQMETVDMVPDNVGIWLFHCHVGDHMTTGMVTRYEVKP